MNGKEEDDMTHKAQNGSGKSKVKVNGVHHRYLRLGYGNSSVLMTKMRSSLTLGRGIPPITFFRMR